MKYLVAILSLCLILNGVIGIYWKPPITCPKLKCPPCFKPKWCYKVNWFWWHGILCRGCLKDICWKIPVWPPITPKWPPIVPKWPPIKPIWPPIKPKWPKTKKGIY